MRRRRRHDCAHTSVEWTQWTLCVVCALWCVCVVHVSRACCATLCVAALRVAHCAWHSFVQSHASLGCEPWRLEEDRTHIDGRIKQSTTDNHCNLCVAHCRDTLDRSTVRGFSELTIIIRDTVQLFKHLLHGHEVDILGAPQATKPAPTERRCPSRICAQGGPRTSSGWEHAERARQPPRL